MLYFAIDAMLVLLALVLRNSQRAQRNAYIVAITALFFFVAFRFEVGCDWSGYFNQFNLEGLELSLGIESDRREPLWWSLFALQQELGLSYPWINVAAALGLLFGIHALARRQPDRLNFLALTFPVLIINVGITQLRQGLAIGIISVAFIAFQKGRPFLFGLLTLLAAGFHSSALIFLLLVPLIPGRLNARNILFACLLALPGLYFLFTSEAGEVALERYVARDVDAAGAMFRATLLVATSGFFFVFLRSRWQLASPHDFKLAFLGSGLMLAVLPLALFSSVIGDRFGYYLIPIQAMILVRARYLLPRGDIVLFGAHALLAVFLLVWILYSMHFQQCYLPYRSWIFGMPSSDLYLY